jgi:hypothetical protein
MTLKESKEHLVQLLADEDNKVIALSGKWGTGKSFMWDQVKDASSDDRVKASLYASLFGASSIDQIKLKLIQSMAKSAEHYPAIWNSAKQFWKSVISVAQGFHKSFGALNDLALLVAPAMLREKVIVLDDIERKHEKLSIDEVLGFIDEMTKRYGSRVVIILNDDQLDRRDAWNTLREKVIDQELRLTTSSSEAFAIANALVPSPWAVQTRPAIELCGVVNIRIVCRVIKAVHSILGNRQGLSDAVLSRVIPSIVLLASIHYKGIEEGPDFEFVLAQGGPIDWGCFLATKVAETEEEKRKSKWKILLNQLGIYSSDEFELLVVEFLQSGLFDIAKLETVIDRYVAEVDAMEARDQCNRLVERSIWEHRLTEEQILEEAVPVVAKANLIDPYMATVLHDLLTEIPGGQELAQKAVNHWVDGFRAKNLQEAELRNVLGRRIHPRIEDEFKKVNTKAQATTSVFDACQSIAQDRAWGQREEWAMKKATVEDFEATIRNAATADLQLFMRKMLDLCVHKEAYLANFGTAMDRFVQACRSIVGDASSPRLAKLVKLLFADAKLASLLATPEPTTASSVAAIKSASIEAQSERQWGG